MTVNLSQFKDVVGVFDIQLNPIKQLNMFKNFLNQHVKLAITREIFTALKGFFIFLLILISLCFINLF